MNRVHCTYCGAGTHTKATCPHSWGGSAARAAMHCTYCGSREHNYDGCHKIRAAHTIDPANVKGY